MQDKDINQRKKPMLNFNNIKKIYFVGIGGIAMSAAANIAKVLGYDVLGSDSEDVYNPAKSVLDKAKIKYRLGYNQKNIESAKADLYILSAGESPKNPEVKYLIEKKLPRISFPELLYEFSKDRLRIVVAGTHGKTTVTGFLGHILKQIDDSSFMTGGVLQNYQNNFSYGNGHYFIFEGDEYKSQFDDPTPKFHYYKPDILILCNLEYDHPDIFSSLDDLIQEFQQLIAKLPEDGLIIYNADDVNLAKLIHQTNIANCGFSIENPSNFQVKDIKFSSEHTEFKVHNTYSKNLLDKTEDYKIQLPGKMNVYNALAAITILRVLGFGYEQIALELLSFKGVKRRFELVGVKNGITIIDDYAHHPTAVRETLEAARLRYFSDDEYTPPLFSKEGVKGSSSQGSKTKDNNGRLWAIFEPHTFSRTKATLPELARAFDAADEVLISEIYPARESAKEATLSSQDIINTILSSPSPGEGRGKRGRAVVDQKHVRLVRNKQEALRLLKDEAKSGDIVIIMAVGNFNKLAYELKSIL